MPARADGRMDGPFRHPGGPYASLLKGQAFDRGEFVRLCKMVMESDMMSMEAMARYCVDGLALLHAEVEGTAAKWARALVQV